MSEALPGENLSRSRLSDPEAVVTGSGGQDGRLIYVRMYAYTPQKYGKKTQKSSKFPQKIPEIPKVPKKHKRILENSTKFTKKAKGKYGIDISARA